MHRRVSKQVALFDRSDRGPSLLVRVFRFDKTGAGRFYLLVVAAIAIGNRSLCLLSRKSLSLSLSFFLSRRNFRTSEPGAFSLFLYFSTCFSLFSSESSFSVNRPTCSVRVCLLALPLFPSVSHPRTRYNGLSSKRMHATIHCTLVSHAFSPN